MAFHFAVERVLDAPADVVYHCLRDYQNHHRHGPTGFLPPAFTELQVLEGGPGEGTIMRFTTRVGGRAQTRTQRVSEPEPGRVLREQGDGEGSTFTVEPRGPQAFVRIETDLNTSGLEGLAMRLLGARILGPLYADELASLERYAQQHGPLDTQNGNGQLTPVESAAR
jgi:polyketide cyclase/dehydrase/lipid transport protein